ncbi:hypothetical protein FACS189454_01400 [Planctomycetales bacterium]|nr:hypothetical protein FACS189454_01400 [Planctomycetales bacterium]
MFLGGITQSGNTSDETLPLRTSPFNKVANKCIVSMNIEIRFVSEYRKSNSCFAGYRTITAYKNALKVKDD